MKQSTILVTGAHGQLGSELQQLASDYPSFHFIFTDRDTLSITEEAAVNTFFSKHKPAYCINCAAYTAVDKAESEEVLTELINATAVKYLAKACKEHNTQFIHLSTDYVFDGNATAPVKENAVPNPLGVYGKTKLKGEEMAVLHNPDSVIIRTAWVYSSFGNNFVKTMIRLMGERESIKVVNDQIGSPTYAADLANVIMQIVKSGKWVPGIYNYSNEGVISWYQFAVAIKTLIGSNCQVLPISSSEYPTPAKRPHYSVLDKEKIKATYEVALINWEESLQKCISILQAS